jgi:hypothetical protein
MLRRCQAGVFPAVLLCAGLSVFPPAPSQAEDAGGPPAAPAGDLAFKADTASLCALVGKLQVISFRYRYDPAGAELRELQPYAVGYTRQRNVLVFGRQVKGYSKSASDAAALPGWRNFRIDKIEKGIVSARVSTFDPVRPDAAEHRYIAEFVCKNEYVQ